MKLRGPVSKSAAWVSNELWFGLSFMAFDGSQCEDLVAMRLQVRLLTQKIFASNSGQEFKASWRHPRWRARGIRAPEAERKKLCYAAAMPCSMWCSMRRVLKVDCHAVLELLEALA